MSYTDPEHGWMLVNGEFVPMTEGQAEQHFVLPVPPARWSVSKLVAVDRVIAAGLGAAFLAGLEAQPLARLRFDAAVELLSDDPQVRGFLAAIGADPDVILAPMANA